MTKFKLTKLFDCQDMPKRIRRVFMDKFEELPNDVVVEWDNDVDSYYFDPRIQDWLVENGMEPSDKIVLIKRWW